MRINRLPELQKELLAKDENLTLDQALNIGRTHEASISHMSQLRGMQTGTGVHSVRTVNKSNCHSCGRQHTMKERCPAHDIQANFLLVTTTTKTVPYTQCITTLIFCMHTHMHTVFCMPR